jgi:hypothetical protein
MAGFQLPKDLMYNRGAIQEPSPHAKETGCASWLFLALEQLPRPTLISCRTGPRASAVAYMYAGLKARATPAEVVTAAEHDAAPFCAFAAYKEWVRSSMESLEGTSSLNRGPDGCERSHSTSGRNDGKD